MVHKKILDMFPTPDFLNFPYAGIQISENCVRCIKFIPKDGHLQTEKYAEKPLEIGTVVGGQINGVDELVKILKV